MGRTIRGELPVRFRYTPGVGNTAFFNALRDRAVFLGSRCGSCGVTFVPARIFCERCLAGLEPDTECGPEGELASWTLGHVGIDGGPLDQAAAIGLVRLDGADTVMMHRLLGDGPWQIGQRLSAVLRTPGERVASILDVEGFRPA
ncbi:MAG: OB-fold domain-containing protein [Actinomycetota bacterium]|nr:OB-fold domain-containing protein [Actinomycetota bacterium]